jgi:hypothetical protein
MKASVHILRLGIASIVLGVSSVAFADAEKQTATGKPAGDLQFLFLQSSPSTSLKNGKLTLASPSTTYFSDRPARLAGMMNTASFVRLWANGDDGFRDDPPNAVLSAFTPDGEPTRTIVTLRNPRIENANLVYDVTVLRGSLPPAGAEAALFIDDARIRGCGRTGDLCVEAWGAGGPERRLPDGSVTGPIPRSANGG